MRDEIARRFFSFLTRKMNAIFRGFDPKRRVSQSKAVFSGKNSRFSG